MSERVETPGGFDWTQTRIADPNNRPLQGSVNVGAEHHKVGERIGGRYEVLAIHTGGMGVVYAARDHQLRKVYALKALQKRFDGSTHMQDLFAAEAAIWVRLEMHPCIAPAFKVEKFDDRPYVVTAYIRGREGRGSDLRSWLGSPELTLRAAVGFASEIAQGMRHATRKVPGLVHKDLKPANVLVSARGRVLVTDFGLAVAETAGAGTPAYMAPEQWRGERLDQRTDIYAFGCILYEIFTGHHLFVARSAEQMRAAHLEARPRPPRALRPELPERLERLVLRCLEKAPAARPSSWDELVDACEDSFYRLTGHRLEFEGSQCDLDAEGLLNGGVSLNQVGRPVEALEMWDRALRLEPPDAALVGQILVNKGIALSGLGRNAEALRSLEEVERLLAGATDRLGREVLARALLCRARVLDRMGRREEALRVYDGLITHLGGAGEVAIRVVIAAALCDKGVLLGDLGREADEARAYDEVVTRFGDAAPAAIRCLVSSALFNRAVRAGQRGRVEDELRRYDELALRFEAAPESEIQAHVASALFNKAARLRELARSDDVLRTYDDLLGRFGQAPAAALREPVARALFEKGRTLAALGRTHEAARIYGEVVRGFGGDRGAATRELVARALLNAGLLFDRLGHGELATRAYDDFVVRVIPRCPQCSADDIGHTRFGGNGITVTCRRCKKANRFVDS